jgi:hypothetical protein
VLILLPLSALVVQDDEPPMYAPAVLAMLDGTRVDPRPIEVQAIPGTAFYRIRNGRHRFVHALLTGETHAACWLQRAA